MFVYIDVCVYVCTNMCVCMYHIYKDISYTRDIDI